MKSLVIPNRTEDPPLKGDSVLAGNARGMSLLERAGQVVTAHPPDPNNPCHPQGPRNWGEKEEIKVRSLAPIGGEGACRAGEGVGFAICAKNHARISVAAVFLFE
jgi:hypothetical protein